MRSLPTTDAHHFDPESRRQVEVLFDALLPGTASSPGASDLEAAEFLDRLLTIDEFFEVGPWRELYAGALPALDAAARQRFDRPLAELSREEATEFLTALAAGELEGIAASIDQKRLFSTLRGHCIEGCFADPRWGGNRDGVAWRWLGYPAGPAQDFMRGKTERGEASSDG